MAGTWTAQDKVEPGIYINYLAKITSALAVGARGTVIILQKVSVGKAGEKYVITATDGSKWPDKATPADKFFAGEALKNAKKIIVYNLGATVTNAVFTAAITALDVIDFDIVCYPYAAETLDGATDSTHTLLKAWLDVATGTEGRGIQLVAPDFVADSENVINVAHAVVLSDGTVLTNAQTCAWVSGITAGAGVNQSNTGAQYAGAIDVSPRMKRSDREAAITAGKFIFLVDNSQNVTVDYDINSLTTLSDAKTKAFKKNRFIRLRASVYNDINALFTAKVKGKYDNTPVGRDRFKTLLVEYFNELQNMSAIQNFTAADVEVLPGTDGDAAVVNVGIENVDSIEKVYMTVSVS